MAPGDNQNLQPDYPISFLTIQMALVSAKGVLGLARPQPLSAGHAPATPQPAGRLPSHVCGAKQATASRYSRLHVVRPFQQPPPIQRSLSAAQVELLALEGATLHLNLALLGYQLHASAAHRAQPIRLRLKWTRNGQSINGARFGQLRLINRQDQSSRAQVTLEGRDADPASTDGHRRPSSSVPPPPSTSHPEQPYVLGPYLDERLPATSKVVNSVDDFLADGRSPNWARLEAYMRSELELGLNWSTSINGLDESCQLSEQISVVQLSMEQVSLEDGGLYEASVCLVQPADEEQEDREAELASESVQCQPATNFLLKPIEDLPQLELRAISTAMDQDQRAAPYNPGDRLSIKCEASGFTLPQITWYLDGWRLSEHSFLAPDAARQELEQRAEASTLAQLDGGPAREEPADSDEQVQEAGDRLVALASGWQVKLRIGDYVSQQDQHVHSFVNSSQLQVDDGGFYKCVANNGRRQIERDIRIDVRGPPLVARRLLNRSVLAGSSQLQIQCPYSGYPIAAIEWYYRRPAQGARARSKRGPDSERDSEQDPDRDEWLSQASAMTSAPDEALPEPPPDYPALGQVGAGQLELAAIGGENELDEADYSDMDLDFEGSPGLNEPARAKRSTDGELAWIKLPQSRRHQVHSNGTLILQKVQRSDQGYYKCRVLAPPLGSQQQAGNSNQFYLTVLVAPVISPFASADSLREGMRNFLTCSVIEGDSPIRLSWLKDGHPIEHYMAEEGEPMQPDVQLARLRVEASNEYTSTLFFSRVEYRDNGNYTCM